MKHPTDKELTALREKYPTGTIVKLISMNDVQSPPVGTIGEVTLIDDMGSIHVHWQNGSTLALIPNVDSWEILKNLEGLIT